MCVIDVGSTSLWQGGGSDSIKTIREELYHAYISRRPAEQTPGTTASNRANRRQQGTITEVYRACGKPNCRCANPGDSGHGPYYAFTRKVGGKTKTLQLRAGPSLFKLEGEVEAYRQFRGLCTELVKVNEAICQARTLGDEAASDEVKKTSSKSFKKKLRRK